MFFKNYKFQYVSGIILFVFVFIVGFVKMNIVYSSTGIGGGVSFQSTEVYSSDDMDALSTITDKAFIRIYQEDYGFDIVLNVFDSEKIFSLKLPWRRS